MHELSMVVDGLPKSYLFKQCQTDLNMGCIITSTPGRDPGAQYSFKQLLADRVKHMVSTSSTEQVIFLPWVFFFSLLTNLFIYLITYLCIHCQRNNGYNSLLSIPCRSLTNYIVLSGSIPFMVADGGQFASRRWQGKSEVEWGWCSDEQSKELHLAEHFDSPE